MNFTKVGDRIRVLKTIIDYERSTATDRKIKTFFIGSVTMEDLDNIDKAMESLEPGFARFNESGYQMADGSDYRVDLKEIMDLREKLLFYRADRANDYFKKKLPEILHDVEQLSKAMMSTMEQDRTKTLFRPTKKEIFRLRESHKLLEGALDYYEYHKEEVKKSSTKSTKRKSAQSENS